MFSLKVYRTFLEAIAGEEGRIAHQAYLTYAPRSASSVTCSLERKIYHLPLRAWSNLLTLPILNFVTVRSHKINLMSTPVITKTKIAERLIESILTAKLRPGEKLGEQDIADMFQVSRTLVREALMHLQTRGFVEVRSRVGWYVAEPSFEEAQETYAARRVVEPGMLRDAGQPLQATLKRLRKHIAEERKAIACGDAEARSWLLADFHICLAECLGNRFLTSMMVDLSARTTLISDLYQSKTEARVFNDDHAAIVEALAAGDNLRAEQLMIAHIDALASRLDESLIGRRGARNRLRSILAPEDSSSAK